MGFVQEARENHVKKKVEEALRSKMKVKALKECDFYTGKYAECASGRTFSVVWKCRKQAQELNTCLHQYTNDTKLEEMKKEYTLQQEGKGREGIIRTLRVYYFKDFSLGFVCENISFTYTAEFT